MAYLLLIVLLITETGFSVFELTRTTVKREWTPKRVLVNGVQLGIFLLMTLLPGIDFGFRFTALLIVLILRLVVSGIFALAYRKNDSQKKKAAIVFSALISVVLIAANMLPAFMFSDYHGRPLTGEYEVVEDQI